MVNIGEQRFNKLIEENKFYIDKTDFIREWWENGSTVTLITRPRRFGKTLNMSMLEDTLAAAHRQIAEKKYKAELVSRGFAPEKIRSYGFAFRGRECLIG